MGAAAGIIGSVISGSASAGQNGGVSASPVAQGQNFSQPIITNSGNGSGMDWNQVAEMAKSLSKKDEEEPKKEEPKTLEPKKLDNQAAPKTTQIA